MYYAFVAKCFREKVKKGFVSHISKEYFLDFYILKFESLQKYKKLWLYYIRTLLSAFVQICMYLINSIMSILHSYLPFSELKLNEMRKSFICH